MSRKVFVYGTLKKGFWNHDLLKENGAKFVHRMKLEGFSLYRLHIPYMVQGRTSADIVHGEVYEVTDECLEQLDRLEGHPDWYQRVTVHEDIEAYVMPRDMVPDSANLVHCGVY